MKRILCIIFTFFGFILFSSKIYASDFSLTLGGNSTFDNELKVNVVVRSLNGFTTGLYGLDASLDYDKSKLELMSIVPANSGYTLNYTEDRFVILTGIGVPTGTRLATLTFINKGLLAGDNTTIKLINLIGSDNVSDIVSLNNISRTFTSLNDYYMKGDMNKNGKIDLQDIILLLKRYLNDDATNEDLQIGDMDSDSNIGLKDIIMLLKLYLEN